MRFAAQLGRSLLYDPAYNSVGMSAQWAWDQANLIATEFDGWVPEQALRSRFYDVAGMVGCYEETLIDHFDHEIAQPLLNAGLFDETEDRSGWVWYHIAGWAKYQPDPLAIRSSGQTAMTSAERKRRQRAKEAVTAESRPVTVSRDSHGASRPVTPHARPSSSLSSSVSKKSPRPPAHEGGARAGARGGPMRGMKEVLGTFEEVIAKAKEPPP